jgi:hypothetical protein
MQTELVKTRIKVAFVNQPKAPKKPGSIKDTNDTFYSAWPNQLGIFHPGQEYDIEYEDNPPYKNLKRAEIVGKPGPAPQNFTQRPDARREGETFTEPHRNGATLTTAAAQPKPQAQQQNGYYKPTSPRDAKRMALCKWTEAFILTGSVERRKEAVIETIRMLSESYDETIGAGD